MSQFDIAHTTSYSTLIENVRAPILYRFRDIASYISKLADFNPPHLHLAPRRGLPRLNFLGVRKRVPELSSGVVCMILHVAILVEN